MGFSDEVRAVRRDLDPWFSVMVGLVVISVVWAIVTVESETRRYKPLPCAAEHEGAYVLLWESPEDTLPREGRCLRGYVRPAEEGR